MGDTGSLVGGFVVSVLAIQFIELQPSNNAPAVAVAILFVPVFDTLKVFVIRILNGSSPFAPDKNHIHHQLLSIGLPQPIALAAIIIFNLAMILFVVSFESLGVNKLILITSCCALLMSLTLGFIQKRKKHYV